MGNYWRSGLLVRLTTVGLVSLAAGTPARGDVPTVDVSRPVQKEVRDFADFTGRLEAAQTVELRARVSGYLEKVFFKAGTRARQGDLLFQIDSRPFQAEVDKAEAELAVARASLKLSDAAVQRARKLLTKGVDMAKEEFDKLLMERSRAEAAVKLGQTRVALARLNFDFTRVRAPIDGTIGLARITPGNLVVADSTRLGTIVATDLMYVFFDVDERTYLRWRQTAPGRDAKAIPTGLAVGLAMDKGFPRKAVLDAVNNTVNPNKGTIRMRGALPNADGLLVPGLFARVRMSFGEPRKVLLVANSAVNAHGAGLGPRTDAFVHVLNDKNVVEERKVKKIQTIDGLAVILKGLKPDDLVVVNYHLLDTGKKVKPRRIAMPRERP